jgi:hypothetical protein
MKRNMTTTASLPTTKRYPPVGFCIYCGSKNEPLTDEHPFPFGLGGGILLPEASCDECQRATSKIEDLVLRRILKGFRTQHGLRSRRKPPTTLPLSIISRDGHVDSVQIAVNEHPGSLTLPVFERPGIIDGKPMERELNITVHTIIRNPSRLPSLIQSHGGRAIQIGMTNLAVFERFLEKIAHGIVVAECHGLPDGFTPLLPKIIVAKDDEKMFMNYFTGCPTNGMLDPIPGVSHTVTIGDFSLPNVQYIGVDIRLFAWLRTPVYRVIVARKQHC